jgi:hypothetical protein
MADDESLVVDLAEDETPPSPAPPEKTPPAPAVAAKPPPVPGPGSTPAPAAQVGLADLQRQMQAERAERARVEQQNRQLAQERDQAIAFAQEAERRGVSTYELYNENQIKATQDKMVALANGAEQAMLDGDFKRASALNLELGRVGGQLAVLERDQSILMQQREQQQAQPQPQPQAPQQPQQRQVPTDPLERAIMGRTEPTKQFLRKHPEIVRSDGSFKRYAIDAHERARDAGYEVDTPAYFDFIERSIMAQVPQQDGQQVRGAPTTAAPVARGGGPGGSGGSAASGTFTMTPKMRRLAEEQGVTPQEWARNYVRLLNEGRITPIT